VRQLQLTAVRAFLKRGRRQRVMAAAHVCASRARFSLRDGHLGSSLNPCKNMRLSSPSSPDRSRHRGTWLRIAPGNPRSIPRRRLIVANEGAL
jgi:hypothetical protein